MAAAGLVKEIGYGTSGRPRDTEEDKAGWLALYQAAYDNGVRFFDTARSYGNEEWLHKFADTHPDVRICTKVGLTFVDGAPAIDNSIDFLTTEIEASIKAVGRIDTLLLHQVNPEQLKDALPLLQSYVTAGHVARIGICTDDPMVLRQALAVCPIQVVQAPYSLANRSIEDNGLLAICKEHGIEVMAYDPLQKGFLTDKTETQIHNGNPFVEITDMFSNDNLPVNIALRDRVLGSMAAAKGCTNSQLALAWILAQAETLGVKITPIPGSDDVEHIRENAAAVKIIISPEELVALNTGFSKGAIRGAVKYPFAIEVERVGAYFASQALSSGAAATAEAAAGEGHRTYNTFQEVLGAGGGSAGSGPEPGAT